MGQSTNPIQLKPLIKFRFGKFYGILYITDFQIGWTDKSKDNASTAFHGIEIAAKGKTLLVCP